MLLLHLLIGSYGFYLHVVDVGHSPDQQTWSHRSIWEGPPWLTSVLGGDGWPLPFETGLHACCLPWALPSSLPPEPTCLDPAPQTRHASPVARPLPGLLPAWELPPSRQPTPVRLVCCGQTSAPSKKLPVTFTSPPSLQRRASPAHHRPHCNLWTILS